MQYIVFDKAKLEVHNKAQVVVSAYISSALGTQDDLRNALVNLYEQHKNEGGYQAFDRPTVVGVYLYTSEKLGRQEKSAWIGMLMKGPRDAQPRISINELKFNALTEEDSNQWTENTIAFEQLNRELFERGLELCSFSKRLGDIERDCIRKADEKFPEYGEKHIQYADDLMKEAMNEIYTTHNLDSSMVNKVHVFALSFCR